MTTETEQRAADWLARRAAGLTADEEAVFQRWLAADLQHAAAYRELDAAWRLLDGIRVTAPPGSPPDPDALASRRRGHPMAWLAPVLAAAAVVAIAYAGWIRPAPLAALRFSEEATTAVGSFQKLTLPDGSEVRLNTDSLVQVRYSEHERRVRLVRGEAHFTVAKSPARPFFVEAGGVAVRAVGTAFNVRLQHTAVEVIVTEGKVRVDDTTRGGTVLAPRHADEPPLLVAGERVVIPAAGAASAPSAAVPALVPVAVVPAAEIERALAWRDRRLEFVAVPLADIVAEFNRYSRTRLVIDDPALAARRFGGSFRADAPEDFVRLLQTRFDVRVARSGGETILRGAP